MSMLLPSSYTRNRREPMTILNASDNIYHDHSKLLNTVIDYVFYQLAKKTREIQKTLSMEIEKEPQHLVLIDCQQKGYPIPFVLDQVCLMSFISLETSRAFWYSNIKRKMPASALDIEWRTISTEGHYSISLWWTLGKHRRSIINNHMCEVMTTANTMMPQYLHY